MKRNWTLGMIWAVALLPLLAAVLSYSLGINPSQGRTNRGQLQQPVQPLAQWGGDRERYVGHWTLLLSLASSCGTDCCDPECEREQTKLHAVHDALGRDAGRVRVAHENRGQLPLDPGVWVVDPVGNLLLYYSFEQPGEDLLHDLRRLLKVSKLG